LLVFYELINRSFNEAWGCTFPITTSSGVNLPQLFSDRTPVLLKSKPELMRIDDERLHRCLVACNTVHTNFVRGNGFVVTPEDSLVFKPNAAVALDGTSYAPLNGSYSSLVVDPSGPRITDITIHNNRLLDSIMAGIAISGPRILESSRNIAHVIPMREASFGQTRGNEVNYSPTKTLSSFTAFGIGKERELVVLSIFAGNWEDDDELNCRFFKAKRDEDGKQIEGITLSQIAELLSDEFSVTDAIAGGGAADAQQYIAGERIWAGEPSGENRGIEVLGLRGLGAVLTILPVNA
jgi:hypothetical protein